MRSGAERSGDGGQISRDNRFLGWADNTRMMPGTGWRMCGLVGLRVWHSDMSWGLTSGWAEDKVWEEGGRGGKRSVARS